MKAGTAWTTKLLIAGSIVLVLLFVVAWSALRVLLPSFIIPSAGMSPTLMVKDQIFVSRLDSLSGRPPYRGEIVAHIYPLDRKEIYMKRIVGLPGDRLRLKDKQLYRNGAAVNEPYVQHSSGLIDSYRDNFPQPPNIPLPEAAVDMLENHVIDGQVVVPEGCYFVMGDNRDDSSDSRYWGFIRRSDIIGRAALIYSAQDPKRVWKVPR
jgi:signal peptidase I